MESIKELQRQGKPVNVAFSECEVGDIAVLHHDSDDVSYYKVGDVFEVTDRWCKRLSDGCEQKLMDYARVYIMKKKEIVKPKDCEIGDTIEILTKSYFHRFRVGEVVTIIDNGTFLSSPLCENEELLSQYIEPEEEVKLIEKGNKKWQKNQK